jgi:lysophospholipase L1-like esterase
VVVPLALAGALVGGGALAVDLSPVAADVAAGAGVLTDAAPRLGLTGAVATRRPVALFIGDSYTAGSGGAGPERSFACLTARRMGWVCRNDGEPGTGYTNAGKVHGAGNDTYPERALRPGARTRATGVPPRVDVVVVSGGRNDAGRGVAARLAAAGLTLDRLRATYPGARIVVLGPFWVDDDVPPSLVAFGEGLRAEAEARGLTFLDPIRERWLTTAGRARWIASDDVHPSVAGHQRLATRLVAGLEAAGLRAG